jgi:hypothetical protein
MVVLTLIDIQDILLFSFVIIKDLLNCGELHNAIWGNT